MDTQTTENDQQKELSRQWIDRLCSGRGLEGAWRLQLIGKRSRVLGTCDDAGWLTDEAGEYYVDLDGNRLAPTSGTTVAPDGSISEGVSAVRAIDSTRPTRIRRFAKGIPASCVDEAIRHLLAKAPYTGLVFNGTPVDGAYVPTHTWWEREDRDTVDRGRYVDNVYTLFQDLWDRDRGDEDYVSPSGCSCSEETSTKYVYDAFSIESVECLGQGYSSSIQSAGRNEDGTYDYSVVTRRAITRDGGPVTAKADEFETVVERTWANVYGSPGRWTDHDGLRIDVPAPSGPGSDGVTVEVSSRQNDDCTYDVTVRTTVVSGPVPRDVESSATAYSRELKTGTVAERGDAVPGEVREVLDDGPLENGVVRTVRTTLRPDGRYDVEDRTVAEVPVHAASVRRSKRLDGTVVETVNRNQEPSAADDPLTRTLRVGESVEVKVTDGDRRDVTVTEMDLDPVGEKGSTCRRTVFVHEHTSVENVPEEPEPVDVPDAGDGVVRERTARMTEYGTWDVTDRTTEELERPASSVRKSRRLDGVVTEVVDRNMPDGSVDSPARPGESVEARETDGGRYDRTTVTVAAETSGPKEYRCSRTEFGHDHSHTVNQDLPVEAVPPVVGRGVVADVTSRQTDLGTWDVTERRRQENTVVGAAVKRTRRLDGVVTEVSTRSSSDDRADLVPDRPGCSVEVRMTDGGLYDRVETVADAETVGPKEYRCDHTTYAHVSSTTVNQDLPVEATADVVQSGGGATRSVVSRQTDLGTWDVTETTKTEHAVADAAVRESMSTSGASKESVHRSMSEGTSLDEVSGLVLESDKDEFGYPLVEVDPDTGAILGYYDPASERGHRGAFHGNSGWTSDQLAEIRSTKMHPAPGTSLSKEKTDGGLVDVTVRPLALDSPRTVKSYDSQETLFAKESTVVDNMSGPEGDGEIAEWRNDGDSDPLVAAGEEVGENDVRTGQKVTVSFRRTDAGGWDRTEHRVIEHKVVEAEVREQKTLDGTRETKTYRSHTDEEAEALRDAMLDGDGNLPVGSAFEARRTDGGLLDVTTVENAPSDPFDKSVDSRLTMFQAQTVHVENLPADDGSREVEAFKSDPDVVLEAVSGGTVVGHVRHDGYVERTSYRVTETGSWDKTTEILREQKVAEAEVREQKTLDGTRETKTYRGYTDEEAEALRDAMLDGDGNLPVGSTFEARRTDGGLLDVTTSGSVPGDDLKLAQRCSLSALEHRTVKSALDGTEEPPDGTHADEVDTARRTWNELDYSLQQSGVWQRTDTEHKLIRHEWDAEVCLELCYSYDVWFRNDTYEEYHELLARVQEYLAGCVQRWTEAKRPPAGYSCTPSIQINDGQLYDGHIAIRAEWAAGSAGMTGETEGIEESVTFSGTYHTGFKAMGRGLDTLHKLLNSYGTTGFAADDGYGLEHKATFDWRPASNTWTVSIDLSARAKSDRLGPVYLHVDESLPVLQHTVSEALGPAGKPSLVL